MKLYNNLLKVISYYENKILNMAATQDLEMKPE